MKELFVSCARGLEPLLADELARMGYKDTVQGFGGVTVRIKSIVDIYKINYLCRIGSRVLLPLARFRSLNSKSLYFAATKIDWTMYIPKGKTFAIDANVSHPKIRNSLFACQVMKDAVCDFFRDKTGARPSVNTARPDVQLNLFIHNDMGIISFDTSGDPLYKRGYRAETVEAPIQESLAAAILFLGGYTGENILLDPVCGSGTFLVEAALIATKTAPGYLRQNWGFRHLPGFCQEEWLRVKQEADAQRIPLKSKHICGADINKNAVRATKTNLKAAGFGREIDVFAQDVREFEPLTEADFVVANPPHGRRLSEEEYLAPLYRALGDFMKRMTSKPAKGFVFTTSLPLSKEVGLSADKRHVFTSGGEDARLLAFDLY